VLTLIYRTLHPGARRRYGRNLALGDVDGLAISRSFRLVLKWMLSAWAQLSHLPVSDIREKANQVKRQPYVLNALN